MSSCVLVRAQKCRRSLCLSSGNSGNVRKLLFQRVIDGLEETRCSVRNFRSGRIGFACVFEPISHGIHKRFRLVWAAVCMNPTGHRDERALPVVLVRPPGVELRSVARFAGRGWFFFLLLPEKREATCRNFDQEPLSLGSPHRQQGWSIFPNQPHHGKGSQATSRPQSKACLPKTENDFRPALRQLSAGPEGAVGLRPLCRRGLCRAGPS
jgi:hypothetical protein